MAGCNHLFHALETTWHHARISSESVDAEAILSVLRQKDLVVETPFSLRQFVGEWIRSEFDLIPIEIFLFVNVLI